MPPDPKYVVRDEADRRVFRSFAMAHPHEAAQMNWHEFVALTKEVNPIITEEDITRILEETDAS